MSGDGLTWGKAPGGTTRRGATRLALAGASAAHRAVIVGTILGALLVFADRPWYASHAGALPGPGLSPLEDQQIAGLIMWIPAGMVYVIAMLALVATWVTRPATALPTVAGRSAP